MVDLSLRLYHYLHDNPQNLAAVLASFLFFINTLSLFWLCHIARKHAVLRELILIIGTGQRGERRRRMQIGLIGTGTMGTPIGGCLIDAGHRLAVFDIRPEATHALVGCGADRVDSPRMVAERSEVVFTSLPGPDQMEPVVLDAAAGVLAGLRPGGCYIDLTTNAPGVARRVGEACRAKGVAMLDAPVSGRPPGMTVMVGGDQAIFARHRSLFDAIARNVFYVGEAGAGCIAKLVTQYLGYTNFVAALEGLLIGAKAGVDPGILAQIVPFSAGASRTFDNIPRAVLTGALPPAARSTSSPRICIWPAISPEPWPLRPISAFSRMTSCIALRRKGGARKVFRSLLASSKRWRATSCARSRGKARPAINRTIPAAPLRGDDRVQETRSRSIWIRPPAVQCIRLIMADRLSLTNALADANIDRLKSERIATEIFDAIHDNVATKADLQQLEHRMLLRLAELEHRLTVRFASVMVVLTGMILAAIRYLPHS